MVYVSHERAAVRSVPAQRRAALRQDGARKGHVRHREPERSNSLLRVSLICDWVDIRAQTVLHAVKNLDRLHEQSEGGIAHGYQCVDGTYYRRHERDWPGGSK